MDKPLVEAVTMRSGDAAAFRGAVEKLAISGDVVAQIMMAGAYTPRECTFLPFKTAPADCPNDSSPPNSFGVTPSFEVATHWLTMASDRGNGEATEMLAQLLERAIRSSAMSSVQMTDVARLHALARTQGFDLQDVEYSCYSLEPSHGTDTLTLAEKTPPGSRLSSAQLAQLRSAGVYGTLHWRLKSSQPSMTVALSHPEGPKVHLAIVISETATREVMVPLPNRVDALYLQQASGVITFPSDYPAIARGIAFRPPAGSESGRAFFQGVDGEFTAICR